MFDSKTRSQFSSACKNQREISIVKKSEGFFGLLEGENAGKGGEWYKERGKCIIKSRIEFPDPNVDIPF